MLKKHFERGSHLVGDPERITALADTVRRERVTGLVG
jgi:hypothetical protein